MSSPQIGTNDFLVESKIGRVNLVGSMKVKALLKPNFIVYGIEQGLTSLDQNENFYATHKLGYDW